jgi:hypothetical protein
VTLRGNLKLRIIENVGIDERGEANRIGEGGGRKAFRSSRHGI